MPLVAGTYAHYDLSTTTGHTYSSGVSLSVIGDISGNGRHLDAASSGDEADHNGAINGVLALSFDGAAWYNGVGAWTSLPQPFTVHVVVEIPTGPSEAWILDGDFSSALLRRPFYGNDSLVANSGTDQNVAMNGSPHVISVIYNGASSFIYIDGALAAGPVNVGTNAWNPLWVGSPFGKPVMDLGEVAFYASALGSTDRAANEAFLATKWSGGGGGAAAHRPRRRTPRLTYR